MSPRQSEQVEYRLVIERPLGPRESRVYREERPIAGEGEARKLAAYWAEHSGRVHGGTRGWIERRTTTLWEDWTMTPPLPGLDSVEDRLADELRTVGVMPGRNPDGVNDDPEKAGMVMREAIADRDRYIRLFNRLEGAVAHHRKAKSELFVDEVDEALYAAQDRVLKTAAKGEG